MNKHSAVCLLLCGLLVPASQTFAQSSNPAGQPRPDGGQREGGGGRDGRGKGGGGRGGGGNRAADQRGKARGGGHGPTEFHTDVPAHPIDFVLGRPTGNSITLSVLAYQDMEGYVTYGAEAGHYSSETPRQLFKQGQPVEVLMSSLQPDTRYFYRFRSRPPGAEKFNEGEESSFRTARPRGRTFTFVVQADPHLDENVIPERYHQSMLNVRADHPDFLVDLGDTFMTGKYRDDRQGAEKQYLAQRYYFGIVGQSSPIFLTLGNHDGEGRGRRSSDNDNNSPTVWANLTRKKYFPNPVPDSFYTGNSNPHPSAGLLQDYYAWQWGDALFVVLDPYWYSGGGTREGEENWSWSLGREQYDWLQRTLEASKAPFKFVFIHHLVGGATPEARGGLEASFLYEWGGRFKDGSDGFQRNRPGWPEPIHELLVKHGVTIVFHGHDHMFAKQDRDGIVYQCVPQPGNSGDGSAPRKAAEFSYVTGKILGSPGYMRITVAPDKMTAELVHSYQPADETDGRKNHEVAYSYEIGASGKLSPRKPAGQ